MAEGEDEVTQYGEGCEVNDGMDPPHLLGSPSHTTLVAQPPKEVPPADPSRPSAPTPF